MRSGWCLAGGLALALVTGEAVAQRSLFDQPAAEAPPAAQPAQSAAPSGAPVKPKAKPKPRAASGPVPTRSLTINNAGANTLAALEVSQAGKSAKLARPLAPKKKAALKLPAFKECTASVSATFEGQAPESSEVDICKEKSIRFTE